MKIEVVREPVVTPPIKEVVVRMSEREFHDLRLVAKFFLNYPASSAVLHDLIALGTWNIEDALRPFLEHIEK